MGCLAHEDGMNSASRGWNDKNCDPSVFVIGSIMANGVLGLSLAFLSFFLSYPDACSVGGGLHILSVWPRPLS